MDMIKIGAISGSAGAVASLIMGVTEKYIFHLTSLTFTDFASALIVGHLINDWRNFVLAAIAHITFGSTMGVIFAIVLDKYSFKRAIFKGIGYGAFIWLFTLSLGTLFKIPAFNVVGTVPSSFLLFNAMLGYGLLLGLMFKKMVGEAGFEPA